MTSVPRELHYFALLSREEQAGAIRRLAASGANEYTIAAATRLSVEMVRRVLGGNDAQVPVPGAPQSGTL